MTYETMSEQNIFRIDAMRFKTVIADADQDFMLKLTPDEGIQGFIVLLRPALPSIS
jgi:hypothetical protein